LKLFRFEYTADNHSGFYELDAKNETKAIIKVKKDLMEGGLKNIKLKRVCHAKPEKTFEEE